MNLYQIKIRKTSRIFYKVFVSLSTFTGIIGLILFIALVWTLATGKLSSMSWNQKDYFVLASASSSAPHLQFKITAIGMTEGLAIVSVYFAIFLSTAKLFREIIHAETPFIVQVAKRLKFIAVSLAIVSFFPFIGGILGITFAQNGTASIDVMSLLVSFIIYGLAEIFEYGLQLQTQADETL